MLANATTAYYATNATVSDSAKQCFYEWNANNGTDSKAAQFKV